MPSRILYDIETNGLLEDVTKVHCICIQDLDTGASFAYHDDPTIVPKHGSIEDGVKVVAGAALRVGHNIVGFDDKVLTKLFGVQLPLSSARDTLVGASVVWPNEHIKGKDMERVVRKPDSFPKTLIGRHSLEAWGYRLGELKGAFSKTTDWSHITQPMVTYCLQDVLVTRKLYDKLNAKVQGNLLSDLAWVSEQAFAELLRRQMEAGFRFDMLKCADLVATLLKRKIELGEELKAIFPAFTDKYVTPKKKIEKVRVTPFNPGSRAHIGRALMARGWKPKAYGKDGRPTLDEGTIAKLDFEGVSQLREYLLVCKRLSQIAEGKGKSDWMKCVEPDGRIHGTILHNSAVTSRCTHSSPNMSAVPKVKTTKDKATGKSIPLMGIAGEWGYECRSLFIPREGWKLVGADASGLELRMLAHYLGKYDGGEYRDIILNGDIHEFNRERAGLSSRDQAKSFIYAWLYGAGKEVLATVMKCSERDAMRAKNQFLKSMPALKLLKENISKYVAKYNMVPGLDGRWLHVRNDYAALNTLLQGAGAVVMKHSLLNYQRDLGLQGLYCRVHYNQVAFSHDEVQIECLADTPERIGTTVVQAIKDAGEDLKLRCPLNGEYKIGSSWAETH